MHSRSEQVLIVGPIYDFLRHKWPNASGGVNKTAAGRALARAANPNHWNKAGHEDLWRTRIRDFVHRWEASEDESLCRSSVLWEIVDAIRAIGPDGEAWCDEHFETSPGVEKQELEDEWKSNSWDWEIWKLLNRSFRELDANEKAFEGLLVWLKETVDTYGSEAAHRELGKAMELVRPLWACLSDREQRERLTEVLKEASDRLSWEAKVAGRKSIVSKRRHGQPTPAELAILLAQEKEAWIAVEGGAELPDQPEPPRRAGKAVAVLASSGPGPVPILPGRPSAP